MLLLVKVFYLCKNHEELSEIFYRFSDFFVIFGQK